MTARIRSFPSQADEALRRVRPAHERTADTAPAGQIPATVTAAFIRLVELLNQQTDGAPELEVVVRDRATGETAGVLEVTEDLAVSLLSAHGATAAAVRISEPARPVSTGRRFSVLPGGAA